MEVRETLLASSKGALETAPPCRDGLAVFSQSLIHLAASAWLGGPKLCHVVPDGTRNKRLLYGRSLPPTAPGHGDASVQPLPCLDGRSFVEPSSSRLPSLAPSSCSQGALQSLQGASIQPLPSPRVHQAKAAAVPKALEPLCHLVGKLSARHPLLLVWFAHVGKSLAASWGSGGTCRVKKTEAPLSKEPAPLSGPHSTSFSH